MSRSNAGARTTTAKKLHCACRSRENGNPEEWITTDHIRGDKLHGNGNVEGLSSYMDSNVRVN